MVKIIVKKEKNTRKQKQTQKVTNKQKQTQKVIVNIGKEAITRKRRAPRQSLQKNTNKNTQQQTPTTVYIPQSMPVVMQPQPQNSMNEIIKYLQESEGRKAAVKEKEKNNELEKDKKKDEERSKILIPDEVQDNFSNVYNSSNISSITNSVSRLSPNISGSSTPILSYPVNPQSLYESLIRIEDLSGGNPNSGNLYVARDSETQTQTPILSSFGTQTQTPSLSSFGTQTQTPSLSSFGTQTQTPSISNFGTQTQTPLLSSFETQTDSPLGVYASGYKVADLITAIEDKEITETLKEEQQPENQLITYGAQKTDSTSTATAVTNVNPIDNTTPSFLRPINKPLPRIYVKDLIRPGLSKEQEEAMRQARINKLDKKPLQIEDDEKIDVPTFTEDELNAYKSQTKQAKQAEQETKNEPDENTIDPKEEKIKGMSVKELGKLLIDNKIKSKDDNKYTMSADGKRVLLNGKIQLKQNLSEAARENYKDGKIKII
jgi:hypothetical protein